MSTWCAAIVIALRQDEDEDEEEDEEEPRALATYRPLPEWGGSVYGSTALSSSTAAEAPRHACLTPLGLDEEASQDLEATERRESPGWGGQQSMGMGMGMGRESPGWGGQQSMQHLGEDSMRPPSMRQTQAHPAGQHRNEASQPGAEWYRSQVHSMGALPCSEPRAQHGRPPLPQGAQAYPNKPEDDQSVGSFFAAVGARDGSLGLNWRQEARSTVCSPSASQLGIGHYALSLGVQVRY